MKFFWGAATSSHQIDGNNVHSDWWHWEQQGNIEGSVLSGDACDHWNRFREDLRRCAELNLNSYRFSFEWARLEPQEGKWDAEAFAWYEAMLSECERCGLVPMATLHHFTLPKWIADRGGLVYDNFVERFTGYVRKIVKQFGSRIPLWSPINEPVNVAVGSYLGGYMPPAKSKPKLVSLALRNLLRAHVCAYDELHKTANARTGPWKDIPLSVGIAHNMIDFRPMRRSHLIERLMTHVFRRFYNRSWLDAVTGRRQHFGIRGLIPYAKPVWEARGRKTTDFIGVNYYTKFTFAGDPRPKRRPTRKRRVCRSESGFKNKRIRSRISAGRCTRRASRAFCVLLRATSCRCSSPKMGSPTRRIGCGRDICSRTSPKLPPRKRAV